MAMFEIKAIFPGIDPEVQSIRQDFYVIAESEAEAIAFIREHEAVDNVTVLRELIDYELIRFRYLQSVDVN